MRWPQARFGGHPTPVCSHRVLGCMPFTALAYFFLWYLPPFTNLRGLWYIIFYCLFQALSTVSGAPSRAWAPGTPLLACGHCEARVFWGGCQEDLPPPNLTPSTPHPPCTC